MSSKDYIKIISYNILADYLNSHEFNLVKKKYLDNNFRIKLLIKHLKEIFKKDTTDTILCLQEVGSTQLSALYIWFNNINYKCIYYRDLCIFYPNNYKIINIEINKINSLADTYFKSQILIDDVLKHNHSYILIELLTPDNKKLTVCTTHLIANPKFENIKFLQGYLLAKRLEQYKTVIFCGDYNSKTDSNLYKLFDKNELSIKDIYPKHKKLKIKNKFKSLYKVVHKKEINITTHASNIITSKFTETIDYIWITKSTIKPIKTGPILTKEDIDNNYKDDYIPNKKYPSDHFMLIGYIQII